jgi:hypothetical protein
MYMEGGLHIDLKQIMLSINFEEEIKWPVQA